MENIKINDTNESKASEKRNEDKGVNSEREIDKNILYNNFNVSQIQLKVKIKKDEDDDPYLFYNIFPNENILVYNSYYLKVFKSKTFKPIFYYKIDLINEIIILSNNSLLLNIGDIIILKFSENKLESTTKQQMNLKDDEVSSASIIKLNNNRILFYKYSFFSVSARSSYLMFFKYDDKNSSLEFEGEDDHKIKKPLMKFLTYEDSFFSFGNYDISSRNSNLPQIFHYLYFYKDKKFITIFDSEDKDYLIDCIIYNKKYILAVFYHSIEKYSIKGENFEYISNFSFENTKIIRFIFKYRKNLFLLYLNTNIGENNNNYLCFDDDEDLDQEEDLSFLEIDEDFKKINQEKTKLKNCKKLLFYNKKFYCQLYDRICIYD